MEVPAMKTIRDIVTQWIAEHPQVRAIEPSRIARETHAEHRAVEAECDALRDEGQLHESRRLKDPSGVLVGDDIGEEVPEWVENRLGERVWSGDCEVVRVFRPLVEFTP